MRYDTPDGRRWLVEKVPGDSRMKVTDIDSPTGYHEMVDPRALWDPTYEPPNLYVGCGKGTFSAP